MRRLLGSLRQEPYRVCLNTIYGYGLRLLEGVQLQVRDIDSGRMMLHVRGGKGNKDRYIPMPERGLAQLRPYRRQHRHPLWLFPAWASFNRATATQPMDESGVQRALRAALKDSGIAKPASVHTLQTFVWAPVRASG